MGLPRLQTCCFVFDLKTGNIVLGCLNAVLSFTMTITMIVVAATVESMDEGGLELTDDLGDDEINRRAALTGLYVMSIILVLMFLAKFLFDLFFVYGVITERAGIIKAYFVMWLVFFLLSLFTFFLNSPYFGVATICTELFYIGVNVYAILLSYSFYKQLNEREEV